MEIKREPFRILTLKKKYIEKKYKKTKKKQILTFCFLAQLCWTKIYIIMI